MLLKTSEESMKSTHSGKELDELGDQIRTKEEEIQILWNVIKEINRSKGNALNIGQLQKLMIRSDASLLQGSFNESHAAMYATPNPPRF